MSHVQKKFNANARQSTTGSRKKGNLKRNREEDQPVQVAGDDPNASILVLKTKDQKDQERKEKLRQEVCVKTIVFGLLPHNYG
jgi:ATP-dependent RNA helicase DHX37/DHR1